MLIPDVTTSLRKSRLFLPLIFSILFLPAAAAAHLTVYKGTLEVKKTSGASCGITDGTSHPIEVVLNKNGSGIDGYLHGRDVSAGHFKGQELLHLQVSYPYDQADLAEGHSMSLQQVAVGLSGELREKHLPDSAESCNFDSATLTLTREPGRDGEKAWREATALWQMELLNRRTFNFHKAGRYGEAIDSAHASLDLANRHFGPESSASSAPLNNLAVIYKELGRHAQAEPLLKRVLAIAEENYGGEHRVVGIKLINLAELYESTGRKLEAEPLYQRALMIYEKTLGSDHPDLAIVLNNLAVIYQSTGRHRDAEPLFLRAIAIMTKLFGPDHPSVVTLKRNVEEMGAEGTSMRSCVSSRRRE